MPEQRLSTSDLAKQADSDSELVGDADVKQTEPEVDDLQLNEPAGAEPANGGAGLSAPALEELEASPPASSNLGSGRLLPDDQAARFTTHWQEIQASFVDQPRESVQQADALVADLMQRLAANFSNERERLEGQWDRGDDVSTEDLRVSLTRYRSFFDRLLSA